MSELVIEPMVLPDPAAPDEEGLWTLIPSEYWGWDCLVEKQAGRIRRVWVIEGTLRLIYDTTQEGRLCALSAK